MSATRSRWWQPATTPEKSAGRTGRSKYESPVAQCVSGGAKWRSEGGRTAICTRPQANENREERCMCKVFAGQDPEGYRQVNRSIRLAGHSTSIQLETTFWKLLDEIADNQGLSTPKFISKLYEEALEINGEIQNFASLLRTTCALYLRGLRPLEDERQPLKREAA
jgi:predicted DNA-binding ribbon-helix-helix protein